MSDGLIDRLVDGELDDSARAAVLRCLDSEPQGWRRCALAFLEAQAWREAVAVIADAGTVHQSFCDELAGPTGPQPSAAFRAGRRSARLRPGPSAMAAAVLLAFGAGWLASTASRGDGGAPAEMPAVAGSQGGGAPVKPGPAARGADPEDETRGIATAVSYSQLDGDPGTAAPALPLSAPLRKQLEARGYRVERHQSLMSMGLENGRTVALPVDEVEVRYVGNRVY